MQDHVQEIPWAYEEIEGFDHGGTVIFPRSINQE